MESEKGTILGAFRSSQALARAIGPLIASFGNCRLMLFSLTSFVFKAFWSIGEQTTYICGGCLLLCPLWVLLNVQQRFKGMRVLPTITVSEVKDD
jgi:hypothetical protein